MKVDDRIFIPPFPYDHEDQRCCGDDRQRNNQVRLEPVFALTFVEDDLQCTESKRDKSESDIVDVGFTELAPPEIWRILDQPRSQQDRQDANRNVDEEDPAP